MNKLLLNRIGMATLLGLTALPTIAQNNTTTGRTTTDRTTTDRTATDRTATDPTIAQNNTTTNPTTTDRTANDRTANDRTANDRMMNNRTTTDRMMDNGTANDRMMMDDRMMTDRIDNMQGMTARQRTMLKQDMMQMSDTQKNRMMGRMAGGNMMMNEEVRRINWYKKTYGSNWRNHYVPGI